MHLLGGPVGASEADLGAHLEGPALQELAQDGGEIDLLEGLGDLEAQPLEELAAGALALVGREVEPVLRDRLAERLADGLRRARPADEDDVDFAGLL